MLTYEKAGSTLNPRDRAAVDELKELYHKTLAAEFSGQSGVPRADQVIEDIFAGGDGWCGLNPADATSHSSGDGRKRDDSAHWSDDNSTGPRRNKRSWPDWKRPGSRESLVTTRSVNSFDPGMSDKDYRGPTADLNELEIRDDLRCWNYKLAED